MAPTPIQLELTTRTPLRVILLNIIQILGLLTAALAFPSPEAQAALALLPPVFAENIGKAAIVLLAMKPAVNILRDMLDNGKLDNSVPVMLLGFTILSITLSGCGTGITVASQYGTFQDAKGGVVYTPPGTPVTIKIPTKTPIHPAK